MRKLYLWLFALVAFTSSSIAQSSANYTYTPSFTGSLTDMSTGTTQLVAAATDDGASTVTNIGFEFWFMGTRYTQFSVNSNGYLRLGGTAVSSSQYLLGTASTALITALGSDELTSTSGKVHYKLTGSAPNRVLVVEFKGMTIIYDGTGATADGTSQIRLYETSNAIDLAYGSMARNSSTGYMAGMDPQYIGFSSNSASNTYATITNATNALATNTGITNNQNTLGAAMPNLNSVADGSRTIYNFTPTTTTVPSGLTFTAVMQTTMTLNWTDNSADETGFAVYRSDDGGITYNYIATTAPNTVSYVASGLTASTNYFWKVYAVREAISSTAANGSQSTIAPGNITSNGTGGGLWSAPSTWSSGAVPTAGDNVTILDGDVVTIDASAAALKLTVGSGASGILQYDAVAARTLTVTTDVIINNGGTFQSAATGAVTTDVLSLAGNLTNNGTLDFSTNANAAGAGIVFTGATNNNFGGSGPVTDIRTLTVNKGTSNSNILELNPSSFTVQGTSVDGAPMAFLTLTNGTIKISGTFTLAGRVFTSASYTIGSTTGFWLNNPNVTVSGQNGSCTVAGLFRMTQGTFNIGTATGNSMAFNASSVITVEGGAINATGRFGVTTAGTAFTYTQSGGTITVCTIGNSSATLASFDLGTSTTSTISISGGTVICQLASTGTTVRDYRNSAGTGLSAVTGSTLQLGNSLSGTAKNFTIGDIVPNVVVSNASANHTVTVRAGSVYNPASLNLTVNTGSSLIINNGVFLYNGNSITNNGTITATGASCRFVIFKPATNVNYTGTGVVTAPMTSLELQNDLNFTVDPTSANIPVTRIIIFSGNFVNANKITLGNGGATTGTIQIGNTTTATGGGTFDVPLTFNLGTGGENISYLRTVSPKTTGGEVNPTRILNNLTYDDNDATHSLTIAGGNLTASGTLSMVNGNIITGSNTLVSGISVATPGTFTYTSGTIVGSFKRWITATATSWSFPVGLTTAQKTAVINFTSAPTTGGSLTASWSSVSPNFPNAAPLVEGILIVDRAQKQGSWFVDAADGLTGGNYTGTFTANGTAVGAIADYSKLVLIKRPSIGGDWILDGTHVTTTGSNTAPILQRTGMSGFSEFAIGGDGGVILPLGITYFRGVKQGNINSLTWKVNCTSSPRATMTLERSADGRNFAPINSITADAIRCLSEFTYDDANPLTGVNYYRLKSADADGKITYSSIVTLLNKVKGFELVNIAPNPTNDGQFKLNITTTEKTSMVVVIADMQGRIVNQTTVSLINGFNAIDMNVSKLANGTYQVYGNTNDGRTRTISLVKQ